MTAVRRIALVLISYLAGAGIVWLVAGWARALLALPPSFLRLLAIGLALGLPVAGLLAWHYPRLGHHGMNPEHGDPRPGGRER